MFGKSNFLDLEPSTMIHADSVSFLTSTDERVQMFGFSSMFWRFVDVWLFLDKSIDEFIYLFIYLFITNSLHYITSK